MALAVAASRAAGTSTAKTAAGRAGAVRETIPWGFHRIFAWGARRGFLRHYAALLKGAPPSAERILDVGCGPGDVVAHLNKALPAAYVTGVDTDPRMVDLARRRHKENPRRLFHVADAAQLPFEDASFDLVWTSESYHHWARPDAGLREAARVLRPGGGLWVVEARADMTRGEARQAFGLLFLPGLFGAIRMMVRRHGFSDAGLESVAEGMRAAGLAASVEHRGAWAVVRGVKGA